MKNTKVLEMIENGRIEELKAALRDEIYQESLKSKPNAKKRYTAMKKYFTYKDSVREICQKPCLIEFEGREYASFTDSYTLVLTTENTGEIELFDTENGTYPDVGRLVNFTGDGRKIDFSKVLAEAHSEGYKLKKFEIFANRCLMHYDGAYFRIALLDSAFRIIDDGEEATVYHTTGPRNPLTIKTGIGICVVMPVTWDGEPDGKIIIEVEGDKL